jgi:hypothetical protein
MMGPERRRSQGEDVFSKVDNDRGECEPREKAVLGKRWVGESMCPWRENEVGKRMWLKGEAGSGTISHGRYGARKKIGPSDDLAPGIG